MTMAIGLALTRIWQRLFAESLGVEVEFVVIDWDNKIMELDSESIDCVWNGMTLTDEVKESMETSNAYCNNAQVVVVPSEVAENYTTGRVQYGSQLLRRSWFRREAALQDLGCNVTSLQSQADALMEVSAGTSDACVIDLPSWLVR